MLVFYDVEQDSLGRRGAAGTDWTHPEGRVRTNTMDQWSRGGGEDVEDGGAVHSARASGLAACARRPGGRRGQNLVEFALILPLLLIFISMCIDYGYYLFVRVSVNNAVRNATRLASLNNSTRTQISNAVTNGAVGVTIPSGSTTITTVANDSTLPGSPPSVTVKCAFTSQFLLSPDGLIPQTSLFLSTSYTMQITTYATKPTVTF